MYLPYKHHSIQLVSAYFKIKEEKVGMLLKKNIHKETKGNKISDKISYLKK